MSLLGHKNIVYHGDVWLGELDTVLVSDENFQFPSNEIRIRHISPGSERCIPLSILHTISQFSLRCKLESSAPPFEQPDLINLHASCFYEFKTAVVVIGDEEIHLVAMPSKQKKFPCFWCYSAPLGLYNSCLSKLNMRCLGIVFDLDETLIVANTLKSFEDRIEALKVWIAHEPDPLRISGMSAELKRYMDDRKLLKQYTENDCVVDYGKVFKAQQEEVPPPSDNHERIVRPVIRLPERNIVLTRINPENRDTSVLVRLRPAWSDLKSYLIAKGRKRFEVYVCTMAERDYALEMWRLLDPEAHLIGSKQLLDRIVCVKSGFRKSLLNVFQLGLCHPNMAMVIDNCCKVWEDRDQPRVHVVPAFTPYYAPHVETANAVPVLCVARNVACNVRGCFFKEFDENILCSISEVFYEDEAVNLPPAPDVSNYLMSEDANFVPNGHTNAPMSEGMNGVEVDRRLNQSDEKCVVDSGMPFVRNSSDLKSETSQPAVAIASNTIAPTSSATLVPSQKPGLLGAPFRRDNSSVKDGLDLRNQNSGQPPLLPRSPGQGGWIVEEEVNRAHPNNRPVSIATGLPSHASQVKGEEASMTHDLHKQNIPLASQPPASSSSSNIFARILETNKLIGPDNFTDWELDLKILLRFERIEYVLDSPVPIAIAPESTSEERDAFQKWKDDDLRVRSYILLSLSPDLKRQYLELSNSYSIITQLRELFMSQELVLVYRISIELFHARLADGKPVSPHVRHMMDLIKQLKRSGFPLNETLGRNLILGSLPPIFSQFVMNFNMQGIRCSYNGLHRMLQTAEEDIRKGVLNLISKPSTAPFSKSSKKKKKGKKGAPCPPQKGKVAKPKPKKAAEDKCHHCGKIGHWRRNCPDYLVAIRARKATALG